MFYIGFLRNLFVRGCVMAKGWKRVNVPTPICAVIDRLAERQKRARWEVVASALATYIALRKELDKKLWYIFKVLNSFVYLKVALQLKSQGIINDEFVKEQLNKFTKTMWQIQERLHIKTEHIVAMIQEDLKRTNYNGTSKMIMKWNDEVKQLIKNLLVIKP